MKHFMKIINLGAINCPVGRNGLMPNRHNCTHVLFSENAERPLSNDMAVYINNNAIEHSWALSVFFSFFNNKKLGVFAS